jgi:hypothetical protein
VRFLGIDSLRFFAACVCLVWFRSVRVQVVQAASVPGVRLCCVM